MKVLIFSLAYMPFIGGAELAAKEITDRISGIDFDMITVNLDGRQKSFEKIGNINIYRLGRGRLAKYFFPFAAFKFAAELHQKNQYGAVWAIMANQAGLAALRFKNKFPRVKYLLTLQEGDSLKRIWSRTWFMRSRYKKIYQSADGIQAISTFLARRAKKYGYRGKIEVVPNGVDLSNFRQNLSAENIENIRSKLGLVKEDKVVVTISRLVYKNGVDTLVKAIKDLPVKVLIIGRGAWEIKLKTLAQELGVKDRVLFLGYIGQKDLPQYLKLADVFVRTSRSEGLGSAFLDAMAVDVPVIGTKVGGIPDFLKEGETGLFSEVNNPSDLAAKIRILLADENLRQKLIKNGRELVLRDYDWRPIAEKMKLIISRLS